MEQIIEFLKSKGMSEEQIQGALDKVKEHVPNAENLIGEHGAEGIMNMVPGGVTDMLHGFAEKIPGPMGDMLEGLLGGHKEEAPAEEQSEEETTEESSTEEEAAEEQSDEDGASESEEEASDETSS